MYSLKKRYGGQVTFHRDTELKDMKTGKKTVTKDVFPIKSAIVLPSDLQPKFVYDLSYIANNKEFTMGGVFDSAQRKIIIDQRDLGSYIPRDRDYFTFDGMRYNIVRVTRFEFNTAYVVVGQEVQGAPVTEVHPEIVNQRCIFSDSASGVL